MVGKINNHEEDSAQVKRGDEKRNVRIRWFYDCGDDRAWHGRTGQGYYPQYKSTGRDIGKKWASLLVVNMNNSGR